MKKVLILAVGLSLLFSNFILAATILVPSQYSTIQAGIDAAQNGDIVLVASGTYKDSVNVNIDFKGKIITLKSESGPKECIVDSGCFIFRNWETEQTILEGFTVTNGQGFMNYGGAVYIKNSSPTIRNCIFKNNSTTSLGGAIYCRESNTSIFSCIFQNNKSGTGGAIYFSKSNALINNCLITNNCSLGNLTNGGGGVNCISSNITIVNCTISNNTSYYDGGGLFAGYSSFVEITNSIVSGNVVQNINQKGAEIFLANPSFIPAEPWFPASVKVAYSNVNNINGSIYADLNCIIDWSQGAIHSNPKFVDSLNLDFHLLPNSACINSADPDYISNPDDLDLGGQPRVFENRIDMGAFEYQSPKDKPYFKIGPERIELFAAKNSEKQEEKTLYITNIGGGSLNWKVQEDCPWLTVEPSNGTSTGQLNKANLKVITENLNTGDYQYKLFLEDPNAVNGPAPIDIVLHVGRLLNVPQQYATIQSAIDDANNNDIVIVADGTYKGPGNRGIDFNGKAIIVKSETGPQNCIIDCEKAGRGFYFHSDEGPNSIIDGFTIRNGNTSYNDLGGGGAILFYSPFQRQKQIGCSPTILNCILTENYAVYVGGAIYNYSSSPVIKNCFISNNYGKRGGGIASEFPGDLTIENCVISNNSAYECGGGISIGFTDIYGTQKINNYIIKNCIISGNRVLGNGGGIAADISNPLLNKLKINNCVIVGNKAESFGGGLHNSWSLIEMHNCIFKNNRSSNASEINTIIFKEVDETIENSINYNNFKADSEHFKIQIYGGDKFEMVGNIESDPCFVTPGYWDANGTPADLNDDFWADGDYHLKSDSPCINSGDPGFSFGPDEIDLDGNPRIIGGRIDMGPYEFNPNTPPVACIESGDKIFEAQGQFGVKVTLDGSCSSDEDSTQGTNDDINDFNWYRYTADDANKIFSGSGEILDCNLPLGENKILLEVIDKAGATDSNEITITVQDTRPPNFRLFVWPNILWPANHKMVKVTPLWWVKDICDPKPNVSLVNITSNDRGMKKDDVEIKRNGAIYLRAEHSRFVRSRTYYLNYKAVDNSGNTTTRTANVIVPHNKGWFN